MEEMTTKNGRVEFKHIENLVNMKGLNTLADTIRLGKKRKTVFCLEKNSI